jgi:thymidylate synthase (FAD)
MSCNASECHGKTGACQTCPHDDNSIQQIFVLDKGFVRLIDCMGSDLKIARIIGRSYGREVTELTVEDEKRIRDCAIQKHNVFRHCAVTFEIKAPLMVARQWWRYTVASCYTEEQFGWNELSRRYTKAVPEFYIPDEIDQTTINRQFAHALSTSNREGSLRYKTAIDMGIPPEQARLFLQAYGLYTEWILTMSLESIDHFILQRSDKHAQAEIREYADAVRRIVQDKFPIALPALLGEIEP